MTALPRTSAALLRPLRAGRSLAPSMSSSFLRLASSSSASSSSLSTAPIRAFSTSLTSLASGQGSREVKAKGKSKKTMKSKKGAAAVEEGDDDAVDLFADEFNDGARAKKEKRARGISEDIGSKVEVEVQKADEKMERMSAAFRAKFEEDVGRGRGKVSPSALDSIKVEADGSEVPLNSVATVSVKGNSLTVNVFDESHTKAVEKAIHAANLPGISPNKFDSRTVRITVPRPSLADRSALLKALETQGEQTKSSVRKQRAASLKALGKEGTAEVQAITDKHCKEVDDLLKKAKKELAD